jgi:sugar lactone lactonase YvrE
MRATITKDQAIAYVQNTWGFYDLSSDAISQTLDTSYQELPYTEWIDFLINANGVSQQISVGNYSTAAKYSYQYAVGVGSEELAVESGFGEVYAVVGLAEWPIQNSLNYLIATVNDDAFNYECGLYFQARNAGNTANQILNLTDDALLNNVLITKNNGWLWSEQGLPPNGVSGFTPSQFYAYAETLYQANQVNLNNVSQQLAQQFHTAAVGSSSTAPNISFGPISVTVSIGDVATFSVTATGTGPLNYQWQRNNVDISGAANSTYITPPAQASNNGDQYTVRVSNGQGNPTSSPATLTVINGTPTSPAAPVITIVSPSTLTGLPLPQTQSIQIIGSGFTSSSTLLFNGSIASDPARLTFANPNEIGYNIEVGTSQANWTVQVVNGSQKSNLGYFTVNAPPATPSGSLVVNLSPAGAVSAGAQWQVDGGSYYSSGGVVPVLTPGSHTVSFKSVSGYTTPSSQTVTINANAQTTASGTYSVIAPSTYTLTLNNNSPQGGASPSPSAIGNIYTAGEIVQLYATASSGYHFTSWSGDASGTANPTTITMNGNKSVTANFASGDPNMGTVIITIQPPEAVAAGVTWGFNDNSDFRASGTSYTTYPRTINIFLNGTNNWTGSLAGVVTITAGQTTNYTFLSSYTGGQIVGNDPRTYFTLAGSVTNAGSADGVGSAAQFGQPWSPVIDSASNIYVADVEFSTIRKITPQGSVSTFAGQTNIQGSTDGVGTNASFSNPYGLAIDSSNNLYVADTGNETIRKITPDGAVRTLAGLAGNYGSTDGIGSAALFGSPRGIAVDTNGNLYVADTSNETIRKVTPAGVVTTLAGLVNNFGTADGTGNGARFNFPSALAVDASGNIYVADNQNAAIRKVTPAGVVTTLAGFTGSGGAADGTGNIARFNTPTGIAIDATGNIYVADNGNNVIREVTQAGVVATLAGLSGNPGSADGIGSIVRFNGPSGVAVDASGDLFITDSQNYTIRATQPLTTKVDQTIAFAPLPNKSAGDVPFALTATSSSGLPVYLNVLAGPAILDTNNVLTLLGAGTVTTIAWQPGNSNYNAAVPVQQSFNVSLIPQTITFGALSQQKQGDAPFPLNATVDSGLPVTFSIVSGSATLSGNILVLNGWGTVTVSASQAGNNSYAAATSVTQSFFATPPDNTIVSPQRLPNGNFQMAFYGLMSSNYTVQTSTNLINWQTFTNFIGSNLLFYFNDSAATNFKQRFYRVMP